MTIEHYSTSEWVDFVRQVKHGEQFTMMQKHLDKGCIPCRKEVSIWKGIMNLAKQEQPPQSAVRIAKASFGMREAALIKGGELSVATLVMDSLRQPVPAGVRGSFASVRQLLYRAGTVSIDLHISPKPGSESVVLVGQLVDSMQPTKALSDIPVDLLQSGNSVSSKRTNASGEFDFGLSASEDTHLAFGLDNRTLVVPIPDAESTYPNP
jgi:hypothetical protein